QGESEGVMLEALVDGASHWLSTGLPVECIKIVTQDPDADGSLQSVFAGLKAQMILSSGGPADPELRITAQLNKV
ncbi:MAG: hypothetical protein ACE1ZZ_04015, partial [Dehalococcoidia bacterium]